MSALEQPVLITPTRIFALPISSENDQTSYETSLINPSLRTRFGLKNVARRTLGIVLLSCTIILWTTSNFLASDMFADDSYSKPYFVTYINVSFFTLFLIPTLVRTTRQKGLLYIINAVVGYCRNHILQYRRTRRRKFSRQEAENLMGSVTSNISRENLAHYSKASSGEDDLTISDTAKLSLEFCLIWFIANYLVSACLEYTSVGSATILYSTSSIFVLVLGAFAGVESFTLKNLIGVLASFTGIVLVSLVDFSKEDNDDNRGSFPHKSSAEIAIGNTMAFLSAVMYGLYSVILKKKVGNEERINMSLAFGLMGLFSVLLFWPGFLILHFTGIESFELPPSRTIWVIVFLNSIASLISDYCWAYSMLLISPLVVTVGVSMSIPLTLIVQMVLNSQYSSFLYWIGACIVVLSFLFINHESKDEEVSQGS